MAPIKVNPIFIPRGVDFARGKLFACIVFTFPEDPDEPTGRADRLEQIALVKEMLKNEANPLSFEVQVKSRAPNPVITGGNKFRRIAEAEKLYPYKKALAAWTELLPNIEKAEKATTQPAKRFRSPLADRYLSFAKAGLLPAAQPNPTAGSQFAPAWRIESMESENLVKAADAHQEKELKLAASGAQRRLAEQMHRQLAPRLKQWLATELLSLTNLAARDLDAKSSAHREAFTRLHKATFGGTLYSHLLAEATAPLAAQGVKALLQGSTAAKALGGELYPQWERLGSKAQAQTRDALVLIAKAALLAESAGPEFDRNQRNPEAQKNKPSTRPTRAEIKEVGFRETVARFTQHPGLMRGLWLTHDCELSLFNIKQYVGADVVKGEITVVGMFSSEGSTRIPLQGLPTYYEVFLNEASDSYFRAQSLPTVARELKGLPSLATEGEAQALLRLSQLVPPDFLAVDQTDGLAIAAAGDTSDAADPRSETDSRLRNEGFALRWKDQRALADMANDRLENARKEFSVSKSADEMLTAAEAAADALKTAVANYEAKTEDRRKLALAESKEHKNDPVKALVAYVQGTQKAFGSEGEALKAAEKAARKAGFFADDLMRGLAIEAREQSGAKGAETREAQAVYDEARGASRKWHRLHWRRARLLAADGRELLSVMEESFAPTTTAQAAPPITGIVQEKAEIGVPNSAWIDSYLQVRVLVADPAGLSVGPGPARKFWLLNDSNTVGPKPQNAANPYTGEGTDPTVVRMLIRPRPKIADIAQGPLVELPNQAAGDRVRIQIANPLFNTNDAEQRKKGWLATEVIVSPVFTVSALSLPSEAGVLGLLQGENKARQEKHNLLITRTGTGFVKLDGTAWAPNASEVDAPPEFTRFLAEGERRHYALGRRTTRAGAALPDLVADGAPFALTEERRLEISDMQGRAVVAGKIPWETTLLHIPEAPDYFLAIGIQDAQGDRLRSLAHPFLHAGFVAEHNWLELLPKSGLEVVRGAAGAARVEAAGKVQRQGNIYVLGGSPEIHIPEALLGASADGLVVNIAGQFTVSGGALVLAAQGGSATLLPDNLGTKNQSEEVLALAQKRAAKVLLTVQGVVAREVEFDLDFKAEGYTNLPPDFVKAQEVAAGSWVEAVGELRSGRLLARGWPRYPVITVADRQGSTARVAIFADGRVVEAPRHGAALAAAQTGRTKFLLRPDGTAEATLKIEEPFRLRGEILPFQKETEPADQRAVLVFELASPSATGANPRLRANRADLLREAFTGLASRRVDALEPGDYLVVQAQAAVPASANAAGRAVFIPVEDSVAGHVRIAAGIRGRVTRQRRSAAGSVAQGGANIDPARVETEQGLQREIWARDEEFSELDGKVVAAAVSPMALLRRVIAAPYAGQALSKPITSISVADPAVVTSAGHGLRTGQRVRLNGVSASPNPNRAWSVTVIDTDHFSIPLTVTTGASGGTWEEVLAGSLAGAISTTAAGTVSGTSLITTGQPHDLITRDRVRISGHQGGLNGEWSVTVESATTFTVRAVQTAASTTAEWEALAPEPIQAGISDLIARWAGWSLGAELAGKADLPQDGMAEKHWRIKVSPPEATRKDHASRQLPLRHRQAYDFRCWYVDLAGNNGSDAQVFGLPAPKPDDGVFQSEPYRRPSEIHLPLIGFKPSKERGLSPIAAQTPDTPFFLIGDIKDPAALLRELKSTSNKVSEELRKRFPEKTWALLRDQKMEPLQQRLLLCYVLNEVLRTESLPDAFPEVMNFIKPLPLPHLPQHMYAVPQTIFPVQSVDGRALDAWLQRHVRHEASSDRSDTALWLNRRLLERAYGTLFVKAERGLVRQHRLIVVTDPFTGDKSSDSDHPTWRAESGCLLLPPPTSEETLMTTGLLDGLPSATLKALFTVRRLHAVNGYLSQLEATQLSYLPDPDAGRPVNEEGALPWTLFVWEGQNYLRGEISFGSPGNFQRWSWRDLQAGSAGSSRITLKDLSISLPLGRRSFAYIDRTLHLRSGDARGGLRTVPDLTAAARIELIHVVTEPLARPKLVQWRLEPNRVAGDTAQRIQGVVEVDRPSTGALTVVAYWNAYWDESTAAIQMPAVARARIRNGRIIAVELVNGPDGKTLAGSGFGAEAIVFLVKPGELPILGSTGGRFLLAPKPALTKETQACLENGDSDQHPVLARFHVRIVEGKIERVDVLEGGVGYTGKKVAPLNDAEFLDVLVLQRPPLVETARAKCRIELGTGRVVGFTFEKNDFGEERRGGFYTEPPVVWLEDPSGTGRGANVIAILNGFGEIGALHVVSSGRKYSPQTRVRICTHRYAFTEITVDPADAATAARPEIVASPVPVNFLHAFQDPLHHRVDYVVEGASAFRDVFREQPTPPKEMEFRERPSLVTQFEVPSSVVPIAPEPSSLWLACRISKPAPAVAGQWRASLEVAIRVYLHRPWRAEDQLAVVTGLAEVNDVTEISPGFLRLTLDQRRYVSEWGYDPAWREFELPPLHSDRFGGRVVGRVPHSHPITLPPVPGQALGNEKPAKDPGPLPPVSLALYDPEWDALRQEWYADIHLKGPIGGPTFVKLAVARYQSYSLPGLDLSPVEELDMVSFPGHRTIEISAARPGSWRIAVAGDLGGQASPEADGYSEREFIVELRRYPAAGAPTLLTSLERANPPQPPEPDPLKGAYIEGEYYHRDAAVDTMLLAEEGGSFVGTTPAAWSKVLVAAGESKPSERAYLVLKESILRESLAQQGEEALQPAVPPSKPPVLHKGRRVILARQPLWTHAVALSEIAQSL